MAIAATSVWEMRTTGANTNGGFYKSDAGTTDYSQQAAAQLALTDLVSDGAGTGITSATGGFTAQMVGNGIYITGGTGFTTGWYEITVYTDTNTITIDRSAGASKTGGTGNVGGAVALPTTAVFQGMAKNNIMYIKNDGTYTLTANVTAGTAGSSGSRIYLIGYKTTRGDLPTGTDTDCPLISMGGYSITTATFWSVDNMRFSSTSTALHPVTTGTNNIFSSCWLTNTAAGSIYAMIRIRGLLRNCDVSAPNATSISAGVGVVHAYAAGTLIIGCDIHDIPNCTAIMFANNNCAVISSIVDTTDIGIHMNGGIGGVNCRVLNCTIYNAAASGIETTTGDGVIYNNDITSCLVGIDGATAYTLAIDYNNYHNNGTDVVNVTKGSNATATNPSYTDAPNRDFTNTLTSANGMPTLYGRGEPLVQGAWQPAGNGSSETAYGYIA